VRKKTDFSRYFTDPERAKAGYETVFKEGSVHDYELEIQHREGKVTPVLYNATVYLDDKGEVTGVFAAARDISAQKKADEDRIRLAAIVDSTDDAVVGKSLDGTIVFWNTAAEKIYGYHASEVVGRSISILVPSYQVDDLEQILEKIKKRYTCTAFRDGPSKKGRHANLCVLNRLSHQGSGWKVNWGIHHCPGYHRSKKAGDAIQRA
jgi:PAS domain S-box-containing protein